MRRLATLALALFAVACGGGTSGPDDDGGGGGGGGNRLTATVDGQPFSATLIQANPVATVPGSFAFYGFQVSGGVTRSMTISLAFIPGPGTYPLGTNIGTTPGGIVTWLAGTTTWTTPLSGTAGSITITTLTATRVSGTFTFTFTATPVVGGGANATVTNGSFDVPLSSGYTVPTTDLAGSTLTATVNGAPRVIATVIGLGGGTETRVLGGQDLQYSFSITLGPITTPGTGPLTGSSVPLRRLTVTQIGTAQSWGGAGNDTGTLTITSITPTRIAGTFSGTLAPNAQTTGNLVITNGAFNIRTPTQ